jgi:putative membrane protein insertion efficiency factor
MKNIAIFIIWVYQETLSPSTGVFKKIGFIQAPVCRFLPTCSEYTKEAITKYGVIQGSKLGVKRILRCRGGLPAEFDPVP